MERVVADHVGETACVVTSGKGFPDQQGRLFRTSRMKGKRKRKKEGGVVVSSHRRNILGE